MEAAQVIAELIEMARRYRDDADAAEREGLSPAETAFYDALADNPSAKALMKDEILRKIAHELADKLRRNVTVDWEVRDSVRAKLRLMVKALLARYKYPPDEAVIATELILQQAETLASELMPA